jgi:hypothetical protein
MSFSIKKLMDSVFETLDSVLDPLVDRIGALEKRQPEPGEKGDAGEKGADGVGYQGNQGEPGVPGKDGRDGIDGKDGANGKDGVDGKDGATGKDGPPGRDGIDGKDGLEGNAGKDGVDGQQGARGADGDDGAPGADGRDGAAGVNGIDGKDGKDGRDGMDGKSLTVADVGDWLEANFSKWALAAERRVYELGEKAVAAMPKPRDGVDGLSADDIEIVGRSMRLKRAGKVIKEATLDFPMWRGVYDDAETYEAHDMVTFGGSVWIATEGDRTKRPGFEGSAWKLAVKKGRDGRGAP